MAVVSEGFAAEEDWIAKNSSNGDLYYVRYCQILLSKTEGAGRRVEFRKCAKTRAKRSFKFLSFLTLLDLALSILLEYCSIIHAIFLSFVFLHILFFIVLSVYKEEVVVVEGLGVQICSTNWLGFTSSVFLPYTVIGDLIINEGVKMCYVVFYLALTVAVERKEREEEEGEEEEEREEEEEEEEEEKENKGSKDTATNQYTKQVIKLYPLFTEFHPRLPAIEESYHFLRHCFPLLSHIS